MLRWRIAVSAILIPLLAAVFYFDAHSGTAAPWLLALTLVLALRSVWEMDDLLRNRTKPLQRPILMLCTVAVIFSSWIPHLEGEAATDLTPVAIAYALAVMLLCATEAVRFQTPGESMQTLGMEILIVSYVGVLLAVTAQLRWVADADAGYLVLGSLLVCAKGGDIGAFTLGKLFGRNKLAPLLSPGKTFEGAVGALLGAGLCGWAWLHFATPLFDSSWEPCPWYIAVVYGCVIGFVGLVGDLCESLIKRDVGQKDSGVLFPGFGGLLDLLDSVMYAGPAALLMWMTLPLATWR